MTSTLVRTTSSIWEPNDEAMSCWAVGNQSSKTQYILYIIRWPWGEPMREPLEAQLAGWFRPELPAGGSGEVGNHWRR